MMKKSRKQASASFCLPCVPSSPLFPSLQNLFIDQRQLNSEQLLLCWQRAQVTSNADGKRRREIGDLRVPGSSRRAGELFPEPVSRPQSIPGMVPGELKLRSTRGWEEPRSSLILWVAGCLEDLACTCNE